MSLPIAGIGSVQPAYAPSGPVVPYAQNQTATESVAGTIAGAEMGAVSVVYQPSASEGDEQLTYSNRETASRSAALAAAAIERHKGGGFAGDDAVVAASGGTVLPPPQLPQTPLSNEVHEIFHNVWAPMGAGPVDPAMGTAPANGAPAQPNVAEASAQATYAAIVDAAITGAPLQKFG